MGIWNFSGQEIYNGTIPASFTNLDISSSVGTNKAVCLISVNPSSGLISRVAFRPKGESYSTVLTTYQGDHAACYVDAKIGKAIGVLVPTNSSGILEWRWWNTGNYTCQLILEGYFLPSTSPQMIDESFATSTTWEEVDISPFVGSKRSLALVRYRRISGTGVYGISSRPKGKSGTYGSDNVLATGVQHGVNASSTEVEIIPSITDSSGIYELRSSSTQGHELYLYAAETNNWVWLDSSVYSGNPTRNEWFEVDTGIGKSGLGFFEVEFTGSGVGSRGIAGRRKGDTKEWFTQNASLQAGGTSLYMDLTDKGMIAVPISSSGIVEFYPYGVITVTLGWDITLLGYVDSEDDYEAPGSTWNSVHEQVFSGTTPNSWTNLDLSSWVGTTNKAIVFLKIVPDTDITYIGFRPDGETYDVPVDDGDHHGCSYLSTTGDVSEVYGILSVTGTNGIIEWETNSASASVTIDLIGYSNPSIESGLITAGITLGTSWSDIDASEVVGVNRAFLLTQQRRTSGTGDYSYAFRCNGDSGNYLSSFGHSSFGSNVTSSEREITCVSTDPSGVFENNCDTISQTVEINLIAAEIDNWVYSGEEILNQEVNGFNWTDFNVGVSSALCLLKITPTGTGWYGGYGVRPKGDTDWWAPLYYGTSFGSSYTIWATGGNAVLIAESDSEGFIEHYFWSEGSMEGGWVTNLKVDLIGYIGGSQPAVIYRNEVYDYSEGNFIHWVSWTPDSSGNSYPGPGTFGVNTVNYCVDTVYLPTIDYSQSVYDSVEEDRVGWLTEEPDPDGASYPGPGTYGVDTEDYRVEYDDETTLAYVNKVYDPINETFIRWETSSPDTSGTSYPGSSSWENIEDYCIERIIYI